MFERQTEQPLSVALMVDTSGSTRIELRYELDSVGQVSEGSASAKATRTTPWRSTASTGKSP